MKPRILITDDDSFLQSAYRALLGHDQAFSVDFANGPAQAHELMDAHDYDAALFDIELSADESGFDLLADIKREHPETSVLMMSSLDDDATIHRCLALGASAFASKNRNFLPTLPARVYGLLDLQAQAS